MEPTTLRARAFAMRQAGQSDVNIRSIFTIEDIPKDAIDAALSSTTSSPSASAADSSLPVNTEAVLMSHRPTPARGTSHYATYILTGAGLGALVTACVLTFFTLRHGVSPAMHVVSSGCATLSPQDVADVTMLASINDQLAALAPVSPDDSAYWTNSEKTDELSKQYQEVDQAMTKRQVAKYPEEEIVSVWKTYCSGTVVHGTPATGKSRPEIREALSSEPFPVLLCKLQTKEYSDDEIPRALGSVAIRLMQAEKVDQSLGYYGCAAETYLDELSMYRVAQLYAFGGVQWLREMYPDAEINATVSKDLGEAYYWIAVLFHAESVQHEGLTDTATQIGWNIVDLLDSLQNDHTLSNETLWSEEQDAIRFVSKHYPEVANTTLSVYAHSMRALVPALEQAAEGVNR